MGTLMPGFNELIYKHEKVIFREVLIASVFGEM